MASVASVYSKALFNVSKEERSVQKVAGELRHLANACEQSAEVKKVLFSSLFDSTSRERIAETLANGLVAEELTKRFFILLAAKNRVTHISEIAQVFEELKNKEAGVVRGLARVAKALDSKQLKGLCEPISVCLGKTVELDQTEEEDLIGGFIVEAGGKTFDSSIKTQLIKLQEVCAQ